jgi:hypothetical protein
MYDRPSSGLSNPVVDNYFPRLMYRAKLSDSVLTRGLVPDYPATSVAISPYIANVLNVKAIEMEQLCRILGYTKRDIENLLKKVKEKQLDIVFIGFGGTGINTAVWLKRMSEMTSVIKIFKNITVADPDRIDYSNTLRLPIDLRSVVGRPDQLNFKALLAPHLLKRLSTNLIDTYEWSLNSFSAGPSTIYYGAPDLETRDRLYHSNSPFISATHSGNSAYMHINPKMDTDITIETYGLISLTQFFMNQLRMAIGLLEILASDNNLLDLDDAHYLEYSFDGTRKLPTDREYNFQLEHNGLMMTPEEAQDAW